MKDSQREYQRIEAAMRFVAANYKSQPALAEIADSVHLSEAHFQRLFNRWAGVSPKQFLQYLTLDHARQCLQQNMTVIDTAFDSGLAAPSRLNELFIRLESVTPSEFKQKGRGIVVHYGFHQTAFGECIIGVTDRGLCALEFLDADQKAALNAVVARLPSATYQHSPDKTEEFYNLIFNASKAANSHIQKDRGLSVLVKGTAFQLKVWEALLRIPVGSRSSYKQLASEVGSPGANRAVGSAVGKNPVAVLIPCHRVIREDGMLGGYRWGLERKLALLGSESVSRSNAA